MKLVLKNFIFSNKFLYALYKTLIPKSTKSKMSLLDKWPSMMVKYDIQ